MGEPLKRHSERVNYIGNFIAAARDARSVNELESSRTYIWGDLGQVTDAEVRKEAQEIFRRTMGTAEAVQKDRPDMVSEIVVGGMAELLEYLEANDVGETAE